MSDAAIIDAVVARIASPDFPGDVQARPELVAIDDDHVVASHVQYVRALSGSDRVEHFLLVVRRVPLTILAEHRHVLGELAYEHYRPRLAIAEVIEQVRAGTTGRLVSAEVARARRLVDEAAAAVPAPAIEARTVARCPRCGSTDAGLHEAIFEISDMRCQACGHRELVDLYGEGDEWHVTLVLPVDAPLPAHIAPPDASAPPAAPPPSPAPDLPFDPGPAVATLSPELRCPRCASPDIIDDPGSALLHYTFLRCRRCDFGEEISSMSAVARWRTMTS